MLLAFVANLAALSAGPDRIKGTLLHAIDDGSLLNKSTLDPLAIFSLPKGHEINTYPMECFIWTTLLADPPGGLVVKILRTPRLDPSQAPVDFRGPPSPPCQAVLQALTSVSPKQAKPKIYFYDRYIFAQRAFAELLLEHFSVPTATLLTKLIDFGAFTIVLVVAWRKRNGVVACVAANFLLFGGLSYFGGLLFFAPLDLAHACILLTAIYVPFGRTSSIRLPFIGALYGAVIAIFEGLSGGIPMALALLALLTGATAADRPSLLQRFSILAFAFTVAVVTCFTIKLVTVGAVFDDGVFALSKSALLYRVHGDTSEASPEVIQRFIEIAPKVVRWLAQCGIDVTTNSVVYLVINYAFWSFLVGWGSSLFGMILVAVGLTSLIVSTFYLARHGKSDAVAAGLLGCWLGMAVILAWVLLFWSHTIVHAFFMARLLLVPLLCGCVAVCLTVQARSARGASLPARLGPVL